MKQTKKDLSKSELKKTYLDTFFSVFDASASFGFACSFAAIAGFPVCSIWMTFSLESVSVFFLGTVTERTPSEEREDFTWSMLHCSGMRYFRVKCRSIKPCSSCFSSCLPSTTMNLSTTLTEISSGLNCWTSRLTCEKGIFFSLDYSFPLFSKEIFY